MGKRYPQEVRARFFAARERGASVPEAATEVGIDPSTGADWARYARLGIVPAQNGRKLTPEHEELFWQGLEAGLSIRAATGAIGASEITGRRWLEKAGGMGHLKTRAGISPEEGVTVNTGRLSFTDRCHIEELSAAGYTAARIARLLGRHRSTISRELARGHRTATGRYRAQTGQQQLDLQIRRRRIYFL